MTRGRGLLVTGAAGFIGRRLVAAAHARGWRVTGLERERDVAAESALAGVETLIHDVRQPLPTSSVQGMAAIVHLAALVPPDLEDPAYASECVSVNALGTLNVLEAALLGGKPHVVYLGSANAYATTPRAASETDAMVAAGRAPFYLGSKILADGFVEYYRRRRGLPATSLRPTSVYGPGMLAKSMLFTFLDRLGRGEPIDVADAGRYMSDLVFVDDVVAAILATLDRKVLGPLNIGAGRRRTSLEVARRVAAVVGAAPRLIRVAPAVAGVEPAVLPAVSIARARSELAFVPTGLAAGLRRTLAEDPRLRAVIAPGSRER